MSSPRDVEQLVLDLKAGRYSRREFASRASALGLAASTIGLVLSACGKGEPPGDSRSRTFTDVEERSAA